MALSEKQVLKQLKINNFRELNKDHVIELASMLDNMRPEVAMKVLAQFPNFSQMAGSAISELAGRADKVLEENQKGFEAAYSALKDTLDALLLMVRDENLSFDEKKYIFDKIDEYNSKIEDLERRNKDWMMNIFRMTALVVGGGLVAGALILTGGKVKLSPGVLMSK